MFRKKHEEESETKTEVPAIKVRELTQEEIRAGPKTAPAPYFQILSREAAMSRVMNDGFTNDFAVNAKLKMNLEYDESRHRIIGCIKNIEGLRKTSSSEPLPDLLSFHVKIIPLGSLCT